MGVGGRTASVPDVGVAGTAVESGCRALGSRWVGCSSGVRGQHQRQRGVGAPRRVLCDARLGDRRKVKPSPEPGRDGESGPADSDKAERHAETRALGTCGHKEKANSPVAGMDLLQKLIECTYLPQEKSERIVEATRSPMCARPSRNQSLAVAHPHGAHTCPSCPWMDT